MFKREERIKELEDYTDFLRDRLDKLSREFRTISLDIEDYRNERGRSDSLFTTLYNRTLNVGDVYTIKDNSGKWCEGVLLEPIEVYYSIFSAKFHVDGNKIVVISNIKDIKWENQ